MIKKILKSRVFLIFVFVIFILIMRHIVNTGHSFYLPEYEFSKVTEKSSYDEIFKYTGLSPSAAKELMENGDFKTLEKLNELYFKKPDIKKNYIAFPVTLEEKNANDIIPLAPLKNGDILVTFSTHTLDWRHGHLGLVTDSENGIILEHMAIGQTSSLGYAPYWGRYGAFAILRFPDEEKAARAAEYAKEKLLDIPYNIFAGIIKKDKSDEEDISSSHCSHIVWQAFKSVGADIDSNGGRIVTPRDVAMSDKLETVQIFGINPKDYEKRLSR